MTIETRKKLFRFLIVATLFLSVVNLQGVMDNRASQQIVFMLTMVTLFSLLLRNIWITLFVCWTVFLFSFFKFASGNAYLTNIFLGVVLYHIAQIGFKREHINFFINGFLWFVCLNVVYMSFQTLGYDYIFKYFNVIRGFTYIEENFSISAFMGHKSILSMLLTFAIPLLATRGSKWAWAGAIGLFIPLYFLKTVSCIAVGFIALLFVMYYKTPRKIWIGIVIGSVLCTSVYALKVDRPGIERFVQWKHVLEDAMIHPVIGWGLDSFANVTPGKNFRYSQVMTKYRNNPIEYKGKIYKDINFVAWWGNPHNLYISLAYEFGCIGLFLFVAFMRQHVLRFKNAVKSQNALGLAGVILAFVLLSFGHFPIFVARLAVFIIPVFALFEVETI